MVEVDCASLGGLSLMERLTGSERVILVDAIFTGRNRSGPSASSPLSDLPDLTAGHSASAHDTSLRNALNVGRSMDIDLPEDENVIIVAIEAENVYDFSQKLSPAVAAGRSRRPSRRSWICLTDQNNKERDMVSPELLRRYPFFATAQRGTTQSHCHDRRGEEPIPKTLCWSRKTPLPPVWRC